MLSFCIHFLQHSSEMIFWAAAVAGTLVFLVRMVLSFVGGMGDVDDFDMEFDGADEVHHHTASFKLLTLHSLSGFFMLFGWAGLAGMHQLALSPEYSVLLASVAGTGMLLATALIMRGALLLESSGTLFLPQMAVGHIATVYQRIPEKGQGKIQVVVGNVRRELLAQSQEGKAYESFTFVKVIKVVDQDTVEVVAYREETSC